MNEIHKMEWIGYGQKPVAALMNFVQDKILYSHKIQLIIIGPSKGGKIQGRWRDEKILTRLAKSFDPWRAEEVNERYMPRHASDDPLKGSINNY